MNLPCRPALLGLVAILLSCGCAETTAPFWPQVSAEDRAVCQALTQAETDGQLQACQRVATDVANCEGPRPTDDGRAGRCAEHIADSGATTQQVAHAVDILERFCRAESTSGYPYVQAVACFEGGVAHRDAIGVAADPARALELFRRGCDKTDAQACYYAADMVRAGLGAARDKAAAVALLARGCQLNGSRRSYICDDRDTPDAVRMAGADIPDPVRVTATPDTPSGPAGRPLDPAAQERLAAIDSRLGAIEAEANVHRGRIVIGPGDHQAGSWQPSPTDKYQRVYVQGPLRASTEIRLADARSALDELEAERERLLAERERLLR